MVHRQLADPSLLPGELAQFTLLRGIDALRAHLLKNKKLYIKLRQNHHLLCIRRQLAAAFLLAKELAQFTLLREIDALQKEKLSFK